MGLALGAGGTVSDFEAWGFAFAALVLLALALYLAPWLPALGRALGAG